MTSSINNTFSAFRHRNYRLWFFGQLFSMIGTWMQSTAQGYLVYSLTGSTAYLGLVGFISGVPSWIFILLRGLSPIESLAQDARGNHARLEWGALCGLAPLRLVYGSSGSLGHILVLSLC
jgi:hypothetical protein